MTPALERLANLLLDALVLLGLLTIAFAAGPALADVTTCITNTDGTPLRRVYVQHWFTDYRTSSAGCVTIDADGPIDIRVFAQNPVVRMDDGGNFGIAVSQEIRGVRNGDTVAISRQSQWFTTADLFRRAYNDGLRKLAPWNGAEFPAATVRNPSVVDFLAGRGVVRSVWPDAGPAVRAWTEAMAPTFSGDVVPVATSFPLVHLKSGDEGDNSVIRHELGHALHFARVSATTSASLEALYGIFLVTDESRSHCFARRTNATVAWIEAFGLFAEDFAASASAADQEQAFFDRAIAQRSQLFGAEQCDTPANTESGPMLGADVEGAIYLTLFHDFARDPAVGLDFVVESYIDCEVLDFAGYAQCLASRHGTDSAIYQALARAAGCYGISVAGASSSIVGEGEGGDVFGSALARGDWNGDGFEDLAVGSPYEAVGSVEGAGMVSVIYGTPGGLSTCNAAFTQASPSVPGSVEEGDRFGSALARGDFDDDGFDDLAIGVPGESIGTIAAAGSVIVIHGSPRGLDPVRSSEWNENTADVAGTASAADSFGASLAAGAIDGVDGDDLVIGVPGQDVTPCKGCALVHSAGAVNVLFGSSGGLQTTRNQQLFQPESAEAFDFFGSSVTVLDLDGDGRDDVAVGAPGEAVGTLSSAGATSVFFGQGTLTTTASRHWTMDSTGIGGVASQSDAFGTALAGGDFDANGQDDLAIGAPGDRVGTASGAGSVVLIYGGARSANPRSELWSQDTAAVPDYAFDHDRFGTALAAGDFDGDGFGDLAIGAPLDEVGSAVDAGAVTVLYGAPAHLESSSTVINGRVVTFSIGIPAGIDDARSASWSQDTSGVLGTAEAGDRFGEALAAGDWNGDGRTDLAIGAPYEDGGAADMGLVHELLGGGAGISATGDDTWSQDR